MKEGKAGRGGCYEVWSSFDCAWLDGIDRCTVGKSTQVYNSELDFSGRWYNEFQNTASLEQVTVQE